MVKGFENLTLETISKIEKALGIKLMEIGETYQVIIIGTLNNFVEQKDG